MIVGLLCHTTEAEEQFDGPISRSFDERPNLEDKMLHAIQAEHGLPYVQLDRERIYRAIRKTIQGLLFLELGLMIHTNRIARIISFTSEQMPDFTGNAIAKQSFNTSYSPDFAYRFTLNMDQSTHSVWQLTFYDSFHCVCIVSER